MNVKGLLELELPIPFYDICTIYPISIETILANNSETFNKMFIPYSLSKDNIDIDVEIYDLILNNQEYVNLLIDSIKLLTHEKNVTTVRNMVTQFVDDKTSYKDFLGNLFKNYSDINQFLQEKDCIVINEKKFITRENFNEFVDIVRTMQEIHPPKPKEEPKFKTEEGKKRWFFLHKARDKFRENDKTMSLENVINVVQFGKGAYIPSDQIKKWSMWKLINAYNSILSKDGYDKSFSAATSGFRSKDNDSLKKHWSELLKVT